MGYMGFGMRKEVYTRKPKKAFEKIRKIYEQEAKKNLPKNLKLDDHRIDERTRNLIRRKIIKERRKELILSISFATVALIAIIILFIIMKNWYDDNKKDKMSESPNVTNFFKRKRYFDKDEITKIDDYYRGGGIASSFKYKKGMIHQSSESYYSTGEQFRSALYYYDTLITEYYFFKSGDTIINFPAIDPERIYKINLIHTKTKKSIELKVLDYKILIDSYIER